MFASFALTLFAFAAAQDCPQWDPRFAATGADDAIRDMAVVDFGTGPELYASGDFSRIGGTPAARVARWNGSTWTGIASQVGAQSPGGLGRVWDVESFDDGTGVALYASGRFSSIDGVPANNIAKWDGTQWSALGAGIGNATSGSGSELEVYDDGDGPKLYVAGVFTTAGGMSTSNLARWTGTAWEGVGAISASALTVYDDGQGPALYVGGLGSIVHVGGAQEYAHCVARYHGGVWSALGTGLSGQVHTLSTWNSPSGPVLVAGGKFTQWSGPALHNVASWNGSSWGDLGGGVTLANWENGVFALAEHAGELVATGEFTSASGVTTGGTARFDGTTWSALAAGPAPIGWSLLEHDDGSGSKLFVAGQYLVAGSTLASRIVTWDGTSFASVPGSNGAPYTAVVDDFLVHDDGTGPAVYASGKFNGLGGTVTSAIARFDGQRWVALSGATLGYGAACDLHSIVSYDDGGGSKLYAAGDFCWANSFVQRWNGAAWEPLPGAQLYGEIFDLFVFDDGSGRALYAATEGGVMRWRNAMWSSVGPAFDAPVVVLTSHDDGSGSALYAGGQFQTIGGAQAHHVARWNGSAWSEVGGGIDAPAPGASFVHALCVHDDGGGARLYAAGSFSTAGGVAAANVARWDGTGWSALGAGTDAFVRALTSFDEGTGRGPVLVATGDFTHAGVDTANRIARWAGTSWSELDGGLSSYSGTAYGSIVAATEIDGARTLWVGGVFDQAGATVSTRIARLDACVLTGQLFCFGDGSAGACPCANASTSAERAGCLNSLGTGGALRASGQARLSGDELELQGSAMPNAAVLYFQAGNQHPGVPFGDGIKCTGGPFARLGTRVNAGGASTFPGATGPSVSLQGHVITPGTRHYQARYRNSASFCTSDTFNYTNAVTIVWRP